MDLIGSSGSGSSSSSRIVGDSGSAVREGARQRRQRRMQLQREAQLLKQQQQQQDQQDQEQVQQEKGAGLKQLEEIRPEHQQQQPRGVSQPMLDTASQLLLRMAVPVGGKQLFFVSQEAANVVRQGLVLARAEGILRSRAADAAATAAGPGGGATLMHGGWGKRWVRTEGSCSAFGGLQCFCLRV